MKPSARHRGHDPIKVLVLAVGAVALGVAGLSCGGGLPRPKPAPISVDEYVAVPFPPRPPPVEIVPPRPSSKAGKRPEGGFDDDDVVWADGTWEWTNERYQWDPGGWVVLPRGARRTRWALVRRPGDGQLFFAPSRWRDGQGKTIDAPRSLARASTRQGEGSSGSAPDD